MYLTTPPSAVIGSDTGYIPGIIWIRELIIGIVHIHSVYVSLVSALIDPLGRRPVINRETPSIKICIFAPESPGKDGHNNNLVSGQVGEVE